MRKDWIEHMVDPPKTCLWVQSVIHEDLYRWETECGTTFEYNTPTPDNHFDTVERCSSCGGNIHMETKEYWGWRI